MDRDITCVAQALYAWCRKDAGVSCHQPSIWMNEATVLPPLEGEILRFRPLILWTQRLEEGHSCVDPSRIQCTMIRSAVRSFEL